MVRLAPHFTHHGINPVYVEMNCKILKGSRNFCSSFTAENKDVHQNVKQTSSFGLKQKCSARPGSSCISPVMFPLSLRVPCTALLIQSPRANCSLKWMVTELLPSNASRWPWGAQSISRAWYRDSSAQIPVFFSQNATECSLLLSRGSGRATSHRNCATGCGSEVDIHVNTAEQLRARHVSSVFRQVCTDWKVSRRFRQHSSLLSHRIDEGSIFFAGSLLAVLAMPHVLQGSRTAAEPAHLHQGVLLFA